MYIEKTPEEKAKIFEENLLKTNRGFNFYVDWSNITGFEQYSIELHAMDVLIGKKDDFDEIFLSLLDKIPSVVKTFPLLFALSKAEREIYTKTEKSLAIIGTEIDSSDMQYYNFKDCASLSEPNKKLYLEFFKQMGLKNLFSNIIEKSTFDYVVGVLVGLDSNGRKNRGGKAFEIACEPIIREICSKYGVTIITQKQFKCLREKGFDIDEDIANRKADFILLKNKICINIEVNFFSGTGSKPEEIIDSYINRQADLGQNGINFALITDGNCWSGTTNQLSKGFRHLEYIMNYKMAKTGMLEEIIYKIFV